MTRKAWDHDGRTRHDRGYGRQHVANRKRLLEQEPLCRLCQAKKPPLVTAATIADHIKPLAQGGAVHDINNLQPVCKQCHLEKTAMDLGWKAPPKPIGLDGWPIE